MIPIRILLCGRLIQKIGIVKIQMNSTKLLKTMSNQMNEDVTGEERALFRRRNGKFEDDTQKMINDSKQDIIMWSLDTKDWDSKNTNEIYQTVKNNVEPGSIILMHDIHEVTAD